MPSAKNASEEVADGVVKGQPFHTKVGEKDFYWVETDEPHASRRREILKKYPQMAQLFGPEPKTFPIVVAIFLSQVMIASMMQKYDAHWAILLFVAYAYGGTVHHSLQLASHELSHNLCFDNPTYNKLLAIFCNLTTGVPSAISFQKYHMEHHQYQGVHNIDVDIPMKWETVFFSSAWRKALFLFLNPFGYALRPFFIKPMPMGTWDVINLILCFGFDYWVVAAIGWKAFVYLLLGTFLGLGLHPAAGHFIAEHYIYTKGQETYSYYGPLNKVNFNVGYHIEHHDFPKIPWSRLAQVRKIAPEFYDFPCYYSYVAVMWKFITDPTIGPWSRIKRVGNGAKKEN